MPDSASQDIVPLKLAIVNARVWTGIAARPWAEAVLVKDGRVLAVGSSAELRKRAGAGTRIIDAGRRLLVPVTAGAVIVAGALADLALVDDLVSVGHPADLEERSLLVVVLAGRVVHDHLSTLA